MPSEDTSVRVEMDARKFMRTLKEWDGRSPPFRECLLNAFLLLLVMNESAKVVSDLAEEFEVGPSTVISWSQGTSRHPPHLLLQRRVIDAIRREFDLALTPSRDT